MKSVKKAQAGAKVDKVTVKKVKVNPNIPNAKQLKNQKDATQNKNMKAPFKSGGKVSKSGGMGKCKGGC